MDDEEMLLRAALAAVAPGTELRDSLERILRGRTGALIVLGFDRVVESICTGGFTLDVEFSATRVRELCKMDGAVVLDSDGSRILRAATQLVPDSSIETTESGTRHRTAERVAKSLSVPVVSASEEMGVINVYAGGDKHQLQDIGRLLDRANQALQTLERYKTRLEDSLQNLTSAEIEDAVSLRDVAAVVQRGEMVHRIADEIETMIIELGVEARLLRLQLDEIYGDIDDELELVIADYVPAGRSAADTQFEMTKLSDDEVLDLRTATASLHREGDPSDLDQEVGPKGLRLLHRVHKLAPEAAIRIADHFGGLARLQRATVTDLMAVPGVDAHTASSVKDTMQRVTESAILDQYS